MPLDPETRIRQTPFDNGEGLKKLSDLAPVPMEELVNILDDEINALAEKKINDTEVLDYRMQRRLYFVADEMRKYIADIEDAMYRFYEEYKAMEIPEAAYHVRPQTTQKRCK